MVKVEMNAAGYAWAGTLDGADRSIRAVGAQLRRDARAGRINDISHV